MVTKGEREKGARRFDWLPSQSIKLVRYKMCRYRLQKCSLIRGIAGAEKVGQRKVHLIHGRRKVPQDVQIGRARSQARSRRSRSRS